MGRLYVPMRAREQVANRFAVWVDWEKELKASNSTREDRRDAVHRRAQMMLNHAEGKLSPVNLAKLRRWELHHRGLYVRIVEVFTVDTCFIPFPACRRFIRKLPTYLVEALWFALVPDELVALVEWNEMTTKKSRRALDPPEQPAG